MNRLVCLGWISKPERKENFSFETRVAPLRTQPKLQPRFLTLSPMRLSHNGYLELILRAQRNAFHRGGRPQSKLFANIGIRISLTNLTFELIPNHGWQPLEPVLCNRYAFTIVEFKMARRQGVTREHVPLRPATEKQRRRRPFSTQSSGPRLFGRISASLPRPVSQRIQALRSFLQIRPNSSWRL